MNVKLDTRLIGFITSFENLTGARVKDAFITKNDVLVFIVKEGDAGKSIGRYGRNIRMISEMLKKRVKIIEHSTDLKTFISNIISPLHATVTTENSTVFLKAPDSQTKAKLLGRNRENLKETNQIIGKFFDVEVRIF